MIQSILHKGLRGYFLNKSVLPASLQMYEGELRLWLTVLQAVTSEKDLRWSNTELSKSRAGYRLKIEGVGEFSFKLTNRPGTNYQDVDQLNFKTI